MGDGFQKNKERKSPAESEIVKKRYVVLPSGLSRGLLRFGTRGSGPGVALGENRSPRRPQPGPSKPRVHRPSPKTDLGASGWGRRVRPRSPSPPPLPRRQCLVPYILSHSRNKSSSFWEAAGRTLQNAFSKSW